MTNTETARKLTALTGWIARRSDGSIDFNGVRDAYLEGGTWTFVGPAYSVEA